MVTPFWTISPELCSSNPAITRSKVVFPHPEGPRIQTNSPSFTLKDASFKA